MYNGKATRKKYHQKKSYKNIAKKYYLANRRRVCILSRIRHNSTQCNGGHSNHWCEKCKKNILEDIKFLQQETNKLEAIKDARKGSKGTDLSGKCG